MSFVKTLTILDGIYLSFTLKTVDSFFKSEDNEKM